MSREELEKEYQKEIKQFLKKHDEKIDNMSQEEERIYIKENKVNEELAKINEKYRKKAKELEKK